MRSCYRSPRAALARLVIAFLLATALLSVFGSPERSRIADVVFLTQPATKSSLWYLLLTYPQPSPAKRNAPALRIVMLYSRPAIAHARILMFYIPGANYLSVVLVLLKY